MTQEINDVACDPDIYKYGVSQGTFDMPKQRANELCKELTEQSGRKHDWHYFGGRVHVLALPKSVESLLAERDQLSKACDQRAAHEYKLMGEVAAPDLLAALEAMVSWNGKRGGDDDALLPADQQVNEVKQAMQAIAKAKGETK